VQRADSSEIASYRLYESDEQLVAFRFDWDGCFRAAIQDDRESVARRDCSVIGLHSSAGCY
jgi:hypothetical protein